MGLWMASKRKTVSENGSSVCELRELKKLLLCNAFSGLGELCGSICIWRFCVSPGSVDLMLE